MGGCTCARAGCDSPQCTAGSFILGRRAKEIRVESKQPNQQQKNTNKQIKLTNQPTSQPATLPAHAGYFLCYIMSSIRARVCMDISLLIPCRPSAAQALPRRVGPCWKWLGVSRCGFSRAECGCVCDVLCMRLVHFSAVCEYCACSVCVVQHERELVVRAAPRFGRAGLSE